MGKVTKPAPWPTGTHAPYVGKEKPMDPNDPRYPIFKQLYLVRVPVLQMRTVEDIKEFGVPISGDDPTDKMIADEQRQVMLPISRLVELFQQGCKIGVVIDTDTKKMYEAISTYLEIWKNKMTGSLNKANAPIDDLLSMDAFAQAIYDRAKWHFDKEFISLHLSRIRQSGVRGLLAAIRVKEEKKEEVPTPKGVRVLIPVKPREKMEVVELTYQEEEDTSGVVARTSMADFFKPHPGLVIHPSMPIKAAETRTATTNSSIENLLGNNKGKRL